MPDKEDLYRLKNSVWAQSTHSKQPIASWDVTVITNTTHTGHTKLQKVTEDRAQALLIPEAQPLANRAKEALAEWDLQKHR